ncbi:hypothetical protein [Methanobacterium oryzae]|uniref:hypothetical protein n=1 Tax=Methanobacterium oryzae TaxID=69540 RepID=UPI003D25AEAD
MKLMEPTGFKIILTIFSFIPLSAWTISILSENYIFDFTSSVINNLFLVLDNIWWLLIIILIISYVIGAFIDQYIQDKKIKTLITIALGFISIISIYIMFRLLNEPVICDPVHVPSNTDSYNVNLLNEIKVDKNAVKESLSKCLENIYK